MKIIYESNGDHETHVTDTNYETLVITEQLIAKAQKEDVKATITIKVE